MSTEQEKKRNKLTVILEGLEGFGLIMVCILFWPILRYILRNIGTTLDERDDEWPGDTLLDRSDRTSTRAIDIEAAPEKIWPWIVQIGRDKAGFYSYEALDNLAGLNVKNKETILQEFQTLREGEFISLHPNGQGIYADRIKPNEFLICKDWKDDSKIEELRPVCKKTWSFYIVRVTKHKSRLIIRSCEETLRPDFLHILVTILFMDPIDFVMEYKMLRTLKRLAEGLGRT